MSEQKELGGFDTLFAYMWISVIGLIAVFMISSIVYTFLTNANF